LHRSGPDHPAGEPPPRAHHRSVDLGGGGDRRAVRAGPAHRGLGQRRDGALHHRGDEVSGALHGTVPAPRAPGATLAARVARTAGLALLGSATRTSALPARPPAPSARCGPGSPPGSATGARAASVRGRTSACGPACARAPLTWRVAGRFVAGEHTIDAIDAVRRLNAAGLDGILNLLGEGVRDPGGIETAVAGYREAIRAAAAAGARTTVSIKPSQMGV